MLLALRREGVRYISTRSAGYNHIDLQSARRVGITVENVAYSPDSVADYTLMLMLMVVRNAKTTISRVQAHDYRLSDVRGRELRDMTIGVVGTGRIGAAVIERLRGFGGRVLAYDRHPEGPANYVSLDALLRQSDLVTLHTPLTEETHHLLHRQRIDQMKPGAFVVNTGRGSLLDTEALLLALESGRLGGAALDVLEGEEGVFYFDRSQNPVENQVLLRLATAAECPDHSAHGLLHGSCPERHHREHSQQLPAVPRERTAMDRLRVAVLFGGCSEEHPVSVKSAQEIAKILDPDKVRTVLCRDHEKRRLETV